MTPSHTLSLLPGDVRETLQEWAHNPTTHPRLGDWRRVGYRRGHWPPQDDRTVVTTRELGIKREGANVAHALQKTLDDLGRRGGGTLQLEPGRYELDQPLFIRDSHVVLRGAGIDQTTLFFTRPLAESIGPAPLRESSAWSWNGGNIFFISRERLQLSIDTGWSGERPHREGWLAGEVLTSIRPAARGTYAITVDDSTHVPVGEMVLLEMDNDAAQHLLKEMAGNIPGASTYDWEKRAAVIASPDRYADFDTWRWPVVVTAVDGDTVTLEQPLKLPIGTGARLRLLGPTIHDSGVESLTIENDLRAQTTHNINPGSNGVGFQAVYDCWAKDIHVINTDLAFGFTSAKSCQLVGISASGRSLHHLVACRVESHDNLIEDFRLDEFTIPAVPGSYLHGINVEGLSSGNVYRRGIMHTGTFDSHRALPFENLRTDITIANKDAVPGGALNAGPYFGARNVNWGIEVTTGNNLCMDISDMAPCSLTAGIIGLDQPGSILPSGGMDFEEPLDSVSLAFGVDLGASRDLLELQRALNPID